MKEQSKQERFEKLYTRTWENRLQTLHNDSHPRRSSDLAGTENAVDGHHPGDTGTNFATMGTGTRTVREDVAFEMRAAENEIAALRRLLADMRHNAAAVICNKIRQAE